MTNIYLLNWWDFLGLCQHFASLY